MKSSLIKSPKEEIRKALEECRQHTLFLTYEITQENLTQQAHPDFSPLGWHLGHIAFTEAYWILEKLAGSARLFPEYQTLFAADGLPKQARQNLPSLSEINSYLNIVRGKTLDYLATADLDQQLRLWWWLIQHEAQHSETIAIIKKLHSITKFPPHKSQENTKNFSHPDSNSSKDLQKMKKIAAGEFIMGSNDIKAQDNERPPHPVYLESYLIDTSPVAIANYQKFIDSKGYQTSEYWSEEGWQWLQTQQLVQPLYWSNNPENDNHPVYGVSYYEAEAYAKFVNKRLPTEAEWEKAAQQSLQTQTAHSKLKQPNQQSKLSDTATAINFSSDSQSSYDSLNMLGNVWEWTNSWFQGYPGFASFPYRGYSQVYFDNQHRVLKGGSFATQPWTIRPGFRNWYYPWVRQIFAGFRCAQDS